METGVQTSFHAVLTLHIHRQDMLREVTEEEIEVPLFGRESIPEAGVIKMVKDPREYEQSPDSVCYNLLHVFFLH